MESSSEKELSLTEEFLQMVEKECKGFVRNLHHSDSEDNILTSDHSLKQKRRKSRKKRKLHNK